MLQPVALPHPPAPAIAYMDNTNSMAALPNIAYIFRYLDEHGPPALGLCLSHAKCHISLLTTGIFNFDLLPSTLRADIQ